MRFKGRRGKVEERRRYTMSGGKKGKGEGTK